MYVVGHDVQELKDAQEQIRAREEELRFFAENIPEAIVYIDLERGCTFVNNVFLATRGFAREFLLGKFPKDVYGPEEMRVLAPYFERVGRGEAVTYERAIAAGPGEGRRWMRVKLTPRKDAAGRVQGFYVVSNDIHDLMTAQASLEEKERELRSVRLGPDAHGVRGRGAAYRNANDAFLFYVGSRRRGHRPHRVRGARRGAARPPPAVLARLRGRGGARRAISSPRRSRRMVVATPAPGRRRKVIGNYATTATSRAEGRGRGAARHTSSRPISTTRRSP